MSVKHGDSSHNSYFSLKQGGVPADIAITWATFSQFFGTLIMVAAKYSTAITQNNTVVWKEFVIKYIAALRPPQSLKPLNHHQVSNLDALWLHMFSQAQLIQLLGVGYPVVSHNRVGQGQDLTFVAGVSQGLRIPKKGKQPDKYNRTLWWGNDEARHHIVDSWSSTKRGNTVGWKIFKTKWIHLRCKVVKLKARLIFW